MCLHFRGYAFFIDTRTSLSLETEDFVFDLAVGQKGVP